MNLLKLKAKAGLNFKPQFSYNYTVIFPSCQPRLVLIWAISVFFRRNLDIFLILEQFLFRI